MSKRVITLIVTIVIAVMSVSIYPTKTASDREERRAPRVGERF